MIPLGLAWIRDQLFQTLYFVFTSKQKRRDNPQHILWDGDFQHLRGCGQEDFRGKSEGSKCNNQILILPYDNIQKEQFVPPCLPASPLFSFPSFKTQSGYVAQVGHKLRANPATSVSQAGITDVCHHAQIFPFCF